MDWFKRKRDLNRKRLVHKTMGDVHVVSGAILIADPMFHADPVRIEGLPSGSFQAHAWAIQQPEGRLLIAKAGMRFRPESIDWRRDWNGQCQ